MPPLPEAIYIDGREIPFQAGQTVLQAALAAGLNIPHLCYQPELGPIASCRLCLVEVAGRKLSACTLLAEAGQAVASDSASLRKLRKTLLSLLLTQGDHACTRCERTGDCRLQEAAVVLEVPAVAASPTLVLPPNDDSHPEVALDRSRCILCGICIKASQELDGKGVFAFADKGGSMSVAVASPSGLLHDSAIAGDDHAVRLCPVGALTRKHTPAQGGIPPFDAFDLGDWG